MVSDPLADDIPACFQTPGARERAVFSRGHAADQGHRLTHDPGREFVQRGPEFLREFGDPHRMCPGRFSIVEPVLFGVGFFRGCGNRFLPAQFLETIESQLQVAAKLISFVVSFTEFIS